MSELREWNELKLQWEASRRALQLAEAEMDEAVQQFLEGNGQPLKRSALESVRDLHYLENEARGQLEQFIDENCT